jgi:hypothetical protein
VLHDPYEGKKLLFIQEMPSMQTALQMGKHKMVGKEEGEDDLCRRECWIESRKNRLLAQCI